MPWRSHGDGRFERADLGAIGEGCVLEEGVLVFNPAYLFLGDDVYVGHRAALRADTRARLDVGSGTWIGQDCFFQSAGGIEIGERAGIAPRVTVITAVHEETAPPAAVIDAPLRFGKVTIGAGTDIGANTTILPGAIVGDGAQIGAGAVVSGDIPAGAIAAGVPARVLRMRGAR